MELELIEKIDPEVAASMKKELNRQRNKIELIASENFVSPAVMAAAGSHLTNKYAEGYSGKRYYGGCEFVDVAEELARDRLKKLFGCDHCNVQPHSGAQANFAVYFAMLKPGDTIMGMNLSHGGHLTTGSTFRERISTSCPTGCPRRAKPSITTRWKKLRSRVNRNSS